MSTFDIESLFSAVRPDMPCGADISQVDELRESWDRLWDLVRPRPLGAIPTKKEQLPEPDWGSIAQQSFSLLQRSRNLRVALYFALALLVSEGLSGFRDGLYVIRGLLDRFWDDLYPQLDPEDGNDPTERVNNLLCLSSESAGGGDPLYFRARLQRVPLCNSPRMGRFCLRDVQIAHGEKKKSPEGASAAPEMSVITAAFQETAGHELTSELQSVVQAIEHLDGIRKVFLDRAAGGLSPDLAGLRADLVRIRGVLEEHTGPGAGAGTSVPEGVGANPSAGAKSLLGTGAIQSRGDALLAVDKACQYFERHEPSSPVPLLLRRAQRLASKTFMEIIEDVCPNGMDQVTAVSGTTLAKKENDKPGA
jgi:type VI secretion system protein ImpA